VDSPLRVREDWWVFKDLLRVKEDWWVFETSSEQAAYKQGADPYPIPNSQYKKIRGIPATDFLFLPLISIEHTAISISSNPH
jgi:hypothetical protein